ncbi:MAG: hypothetical protein WCF84_23410 [Anaerolineae bacterium]
MKHRLFSVAVLLGLAVLSILLSPGATPRAQAQGLTVTGVNVGATVTPKSFDGDLRTVTAQPTSTTHTLPRRIATTGLPVVQGADPAVQSQATANQMPSPLKSFDGLSLNASCTGGNCGNGWPPDTNGDVGPNHYVQTVNTSIGVFSKSTGSRLLGITFDSFWSAAGGTSTPCDNNNQGDPVALYDTLADRWLVADFAWTDSVNGPFYECIAVSKGSDPVSGGWWFYPIQSPGSDFPDYPKFGLWPDGYYMMTNQFGVSTFDGVRLWAFDRNKMINGQAINFPYVDISSAGGAMPANLRGAQPPANTPEYFVSIDSPSTNMLHVWKFHFDTTTPANSTVSGPTNISVNSFVEPCNAANTTPCIPTKGGEKVDGLGDRLMVQVQYRNIGGTESLWTTHTVANTASTGSVTGIRWYQLNVTGGTIQTTPVQQSTFKPDSNFRWMPSLAVDKFGNMAVGYSIASSTMYPGLRYTGRLSTDPTNQLPQGETTLIAGTGSQSGGFNRWGDYSAMTVDPNDDCTFWYTNEYYKTTGSNWQTRIGSFQYPQCTFANGTTTPDSDSSVQYDGWAGVQDAGASGGWYRASSTTGNKAALSFTGTSVKWVYPTGPGQGNAQVLVDGVSKGTVDQYSAAPLSQQSRTYSGLTNAHHTLTIKVLGTHNVSSTGNKVAVDAFVVGATTSEEIANAIKWDTWVLTTSASALGGAYRSNATLNATITFQFTGTAIKWIAVKGPGYGKAEVYIDSIDQGPVDLYSASTQYLQAISYSGLSAGAHTIQMKVLHTKSAASTGYKVAFDGFNVTP